MRVNRAAVATVAGVVLVVGAGSALAAIPSTSTGSITGCVNRSSGAVRIIDYQAGRRCASTERTLNWSAGYRYRGAYSAGTGYSTLDVVSYAGSSYVARAASTGDLPSTHPTQWGLLAAKGAAGQAGPPGPAGPAGPGTLAALDGTVAADGQDHPVGSVPFDLNGLTGTLDVDGRCSTGTPDTADLDVASAVGYSSFAGSVVDSTSVNGGPATVTTRFVSGTVDGALGAVSRLLRLDGVSAAGSVDSAVADLVLQPDGTGLEPLVVHAVITADNRVTTANPSGALLCSVAGTAGRGTVQ